MCEVIMREVISNNNFDMLSIDKDITVVRGYEEVSFSSTDKEKDEVLDFYLRDHHINNVKCNKNGISFNSSRIIASKNVRLGNIVNDSRLELGYKSDMSLMSKAFKKFFNDRANYIYKNEFNSIRIIESNDSCRYLSFENNLFIEIFDNEIDLDFIWNYIRSLTKGEELSIKYRSVYWFPNEPDRRRGYDCIPYISGLKKEVVFDNILMPFIRCIVSDYNKELNEFDVLQLKLKNFR